MKFANTWRCTVVTVINRELREACLDYKKYKKLSKDLDTPDTVILKRLQDDVRLASRVFQEHVSVWNSPKRSETCIPILFCNRKLGASPEDLYKFAVFNTTTLYKICKRLDKRHNTTIYTGWYRKSIREKMISFVNKNIQTVLSFYVESSRTQECPICLEESYEDAIVLDCGHAVCSHCVLSMLHVQNIKGTIINRIAYGAYEHPKEARCPICRDPGALAKYTIIKTRQQTA